MDGFEDIGSERVALTRVNGGEDNGGADVSTIRLSSRYRTVVAESVVFGGPLNGRTRRYVSLDEARAGHDDLVSDVREAQR